MAKSELSDAELRRKEQFDALTAEMEEEGYECNFLSISIKAASWFSIALLIVAAVIWGIWYVVANPDLPLPTISNMSITEMLLLVAGMFASIVLHELVHGITWSIFCKNHFKSIEFGVKWKSLTPYCTCSEALSRENYVIGALMPLIVVGILPAVISVYIGSPVLLYIGVVMITGASGDIMCVQRLLQYREHDDCIYYDHPYEVGMVVFEKES